FPLVLGIVSAGLGLLVERIVGARLQSALLLPCGFALRGVVAGVATTSGTTAGLALPAALVLTAAGLVLGGRERSWRPDAWAAAAAASVFAVAAAPVVLSGDATFAGYTQLDDTST